MRQGSRGQGVKGSRVRSQKSKIFNLKLITHNSKLHSKGFTLIELIIFIIIAGIFLPATYVAFSSAMRQATQPEDYTRGMLLAEQTMELAVKRGFSTLSTDVSGPCTNIGAVVPSGYVCTWTPLVLPTNFFSGLTLSANNYIQISVTINTPQGNTFSSIGIVTNHGY